MEAVVHVAEGEDVGVVDLVVVVAVVVAVVLPQLPIASLPMDFDS